MAAPNTDPIYSRAGVVSTDNGTSMPATLTTAAADYTGAGASNIQIFGADATNGSFVQRLRCKSIGTNIATVLRVFLNNGSNHTTASNNTFYGELSLPATTASANSATPDIDYPMNIALNPSFSIVVGLGTTVAAGWVVSAVGGKY